MVPQKRVYDLKKSEEHLNKLLTEASAQTGKTPEELIRGALMEFAIPPMIDRLPGERLRPFVKRLIVWANEQNGKCMGEFRKVYLVARPGMSEDFLIGYFYGCFETREIQSSKVSGGNNVTN